MRTTTAPGSDSANESDDVERRYRSVWLDMVDTDFRQGHQVVGGIRTRYVEAGSPSAPVVVMLHGTGGHWETFCGNIPALAADYHCFALDMIGCGFTDRPDRPYEIGDYVEHVLGFLDAFGIESATFIGVSLGSWVASRLALVAPHRVAGLIMNAPSGLLQISPDARAAATANRTRARAEPTWANAKAVLAQLFFDESAIIDDLVAVRMMTTAQSAADASGTPRTLTLLEPEVRARIS